MALLLQIHETGITKLQALGLYELDGAPADVEEYEKSLRGRPQYKQLARVVDLELSFVRDRLDDPHLPAWERPLAEAARKAWEKALHPHPNSRGWDNMTVKERARWLRNRVDRYKKRGLLPKDADPGYRLNRQLREDENYRPRGFTGKLWRSKSQAKADRLREELQALEDGRRRE